MLLKGSFFYWILGCMSQLVVRQDVSQDITLTIIPFLLFLSMCVTIPNIFYLKYIQFVTTLLLETGRVPARLVLLTFPFGSD